MMPCHTHTHTEVGYQSSPQEKTKSRGYISFKRKYPAGVTQALQAYEENPEVVLPPPKKVTSLPKSSTPSARGRPPNSGCPRIGQVPTPPKPPTAMVKQAVALMKDMDLQDKLVFTREVAKDLDLECMESVADATFYELACKKEIPPPKSPKDFASLATNAMFRLEFTDRPNLVYK